MPRRPRIQVPGGTYYVLQISNRHQPLFHDPSDYQTFESLLRRALERTRTELYAYCWLPHALHLAVRGNDEPLGQFMQGFTSRYAHHLHRRSHDVGHLFVRRFQSLLIDPQAWLPELTRFIHHAPVTANCATTAADYLHSSLAIYLGTRRSPWVTTAPVFRILEQRGLTRSEATHYLQSAPSPAETAALSHTGTMRILGDEQFISTLPRSQRPLRPRTTLNQLIDAIAVSQGLTRTDLASPSRRRDTSLARSLVGWHATHRRIASLSEVARVLGRDPSTLSKAIIRHRRQHPHLFRLDALSHLLPLG